MSNFTPGPWKAQADDFGYWGVYDKESNCIAEAAEPGNCNLEDIQLMTTAPEMVDMLENAAVVLNNAASYINNERYMEDMLRLSASIWTFLSRFGLSKEAAE